MRKMKGLVLLFVVAIAACRETSGQGMPDLCYVSISVTVFLRGKRWVIYGVYT